MFADNQEKVATDNESFRSYDIVDQSFKEPLHKRPYWECVLVYAGRVVAQLDAERVYFEPGMIAFVPPGIFHSWETAGAERASCLVFQFGNEAVPQALLAAVELLHVKARLKNEKAPSVSRAADLERLRARMRSVHRSRGVFRLARFWVAMDLACQQPILQIAGDKGETALGAKQTARLNRAKEVIENRFSEALKRKEVASEVGMEEAAFSRFFHEASGMRFADYLANRRVSRAASLLNARRDISVSAVARQCGFRNVSAFNRQFRKRMGTTPTAYRKSADIEPILP